MTTRAEFIAATIGLAIAPAAALLPAEAIAAVPEDQRAALGPPRPPAGHWLLELHYHSGQTRTEVVGVDHAEACEYCTVQSINVCTDADQTWLGERRFDHGIYDYGIRAEVYAPPVRYQVQLRHLDGHLELIDQPDLVRGTIYQAVAS